MKIIYGICSWGLGHATRSLPIIRKLIQEDNELIIISNGRSLQLLRKELGENLEYIDIPDYPMLLSENSRQFMAKSMHGKKHDLLAKVHCETPLWPR